MEPVFGILGLVVVIGSCVGAWKLSRFCATHVAVRLLLSVVFALVLIVAGLTAVVAGCVASIGGMDFR
jgi:hypothetical protein